MKNNNYEFIRSHNLVTRIYDMTFYFGIIKDSKNERVIKDFFKEHLNDVEYVESLAKYFEIKLRKIKKNIDLKCNLKELVYDLNSLKQYLE